MPRSDLPTPYVSMGFYRLALAFLVFSSHLLRPIVPARFDSGILGVCCFFVASGWNISNVAVTAYSERPGAFLLNRATRLYPSLWAALLLAVALLEISGRPSVGYLSTRGWTLERIVSAISIVPAYPVTKWGPLPSGWSLTVEMCFYLVIFATMWWRFNLRFVCWAACAVFVACTFKSWRWENALLYIPFFVAGAAFYLSRKDRRPLDFLLGGVSVLLSCWAITLIVQPGSLRSLPYQIGLFVAMMIIFIIVTAAPLPRRVRKFDRWAGDLTYPIYVLQIPITSYLQGMGYIGPSMRDRLLLWVICCASAWALHLTVERPLAAIRSKIRGSAPELSFGGRRHGAPDLQN